MQNLCYPSHPIGRIPEYIHGCVASKHKCRENSRSSCDENTEQYKPSSLRRQRSILWKLERYLAAREAALKSKAGMEMHIWKRPQSARRQTPIGRKRAQAGSKKTWAKGVPVQGRRAGERRHDSGAGRRDIRSREGHQPKEHGTA